MLILSFVSWYVWVSLWLGIGIIVIVHYFHLFNYFYEGKWKENWYRTVIAVLLWPITWAISFACCR